MELAIYHCKGKFQLINLKYNYISLSNFFLFIDREFKDTIVVAYLLEYYSNRAADFAGWMITVSKALPLLYKYSLGSLFFSDFIFNQIFYNEFARFEILFIHR